MAPERYRRLREVFDAAVDLRFEDRDAFVERECGGDDALRLELTRLLRREAAIADAHTRSPADVLERGIEDAASRLDRLQAFGPYRLEEELGSGGMGRVFRAVRIDGAFEQEVAIKLMRRELVNPALLKRFSTERAVLAALDDPGISRLIDAGEAPDGTPYVVMEYVRGTPLIAYCDRRRLTVRERVALFRRIVAAVAHAHRNLVVHRDLKPGNVLVTDDGVPKLLDFGIAKPLAGGDAATLTADRFFTPAYAAPEQLRGGAITVGCDVYALGVLLYELLTGRLPFEPADLTAGEIERLILFVPPPAMGALVTQGDAWLASVRGAANVRELRRQVGGDLEAIVQRALRKEASERYRTAEQLDADLASYLQDRPISARPSHVTYRARKFILRHRLAVASGLVAAVVLMVALGALVAQSIAVREERDRAAFALDVLQSAFVSADPGNAQGGDVRAKDILAAARSRLDEIADARPETFASLSSTIAEVEYEIGMKSESMRTAARAIAAVRGRVVADGTLERLLIVHGNASVSVNDMTSARRSLEDARKGASDWTEWQLAYGRYLTRIGDTDQARPYVAAALARTRGLGPMSLLATNARWYEADLLRSAADHVGALAAIESTLTWQRAGLPAGNPRIMQSRMRRVQILRNVDRADEALSEALQVTTEIDAHYGVDSALASYARNVLGSLLMAAQRNEDAADAYRIGADGWEKAVGPRHVNTLRARFNQAIAESRAPARQSAADTHFGEVVRLASEELGIESELALNFRLGHGEFLEQTGRARDALAVLTEPKALHATTRMSPENREEFRVVLDRVQASAGCDVGGRGSYLRERCDAAREAAHRLTAR